MVAEDALAAAKAAALQDLLAGDPSDEAATAPERDERQQNDHPKVESRKVRRRRRKRPPTRPQAPPDSPDKEQLSADVDFTPEAVDNVVSSINQTTDSEHASAVHDIVSVLHRFAEMGPDAAVQDAGEEESDERANKNTPGKADASRNDANNQPSDAHAAGSNANANGTENPDKPLSRKKQKEERRKLIARLKELSNEPEVVESWDINAPDPLLLVHLKAWPNTVPVPINWRQKRKYLQNKRGMEKRAFQLPHYIVDTGVGELRDAQIEADEKKTLKQRQREKMRAKTGRGVEIDHQRLHDAFFKFQTKPRLTKHGDVYYELKELEVDGSQFKPGVVSEELRAALGLGVHDPPPWLINMQRYGPPPGYPGLQVPGVNAAIPPGARFGYQVGGWGKPPVDANGRPIYGDVFGEGLLYGKKGRFDMTDSQKQWLWGEFEVDDRGTTVIGDDDEEEEGEEEDEEDEEEEKQAVGPTAKWIPTQKLAGDEATAKKAAGAERGTPSDVEVRKGIARGKLFSVLEQRKVSVGESGMMGSSHVYEMKDGEGNPLRESGSEVAAERQEDRERKDAERENGADKRMRDSGDSDVRRARPAKKQKEFKF